MLWTAFENFFALIVSGRLHSQVSSVALQRMISQMREPHGREFNRNVAAQYKKQLNIIVDSNVTKIGQIAIEVERGRSLGDIDVLVIEPEKKRVVVIECKDLVLARTSYEFHQELSELFSAPESHLKKHLRRVAWAKEHLHAILSHYGVPVSEGWEVKSRIVIDQPLMAVHLSPDPTTELILYKDLSHFVASKLSQ